MNTFFNLKSFFKFLGRNKFYTAIDIFGLSVSLMFVILIAVYTWQELSTDRFHEKADRIYVLGNGEDFGSAYRLAARIRDRYPEVENICTLVPRFDRMPVLLGDTKLMADLMFADTSFFDLFSFKMLNGGRERALVARNYAVISESFSRKVFGDRDPIGESLCVNDSVTVIVNGVMEDIRNSTIPYFDILLRIDHIRFFNSSLDSESFDNAGGAMNFILQRKGTDLSSKTEDMKAWFKEIFWVYKNDIWHDVTLTPLKEVYFSEYASGMHLLYSGDWSFVMILFSVGLVVLIFALINYINLTVAQTGFRAKEMAVRRLLGSSRGELFARLMLEATVLSFVSFVFATVLAFIFAPYAGRLLETDMDMMGAVTPWSILAVLLLILSLGAVSGFLPAFVISGAKPIEVVRGVLRKKTRMVFSKCFITFQNAITITLIAVSITMFMQVKHLQNAPLGYNTTNILTVGTDQIEGREQLTTLANELRQLACVGRIAFSAGTPFNKGNNNTMQHKDKMISFQVLRGDSSFYDMMGFQMMRDNHVTNKNRFFFTEQALKIMGENDDIPSYRWWGTEYPVAGVLKDFRLGNITNSMEPVIVMIHDLEDFYPWNVLIEIVGSPQEAYGQVSDVYKKVVGLDFNGMFIDRQIQRSFASLQRISIVVTVFAVIAILISLLGLLAMSTYFIQQRSMEIAVRKVFGSGNGLILFNLVRIFLNYVLIAFVIAVPFIWHFMHRWLSEYSYRIDLVPLIFITAGLFCLLVSFVAVVVQSYQAATANPVNSIKVQ